MRLSIRAERPAGKFHKPPFPTILDELAVKPRLFEENFREEVYSKSVEDALHAVMSGDEEGKIWGTYVLGKALSIGHPSHLIELSLFAGLYDPSDKVRTNCSWAFSEAAVCGKLSRMAVNALERGLDDPCSEVRGNCAIALTIHYMKNGMEDGVNRLVNHKRREIRIMAHSTVKAGEIC